MCNRAAATVADRSSLDTQAKTTSTCSSPFYRLQFPYVEPGVPSSPRLQILLQPPEKSWVV